MPARAPLHLVVGALLAVSLAGSTPAAGADPSGCGGTRWVGTWAAAPSDGGLTGGGTVGRPLADQTLRMVVRPSLSGTTVRLRLTNRYAGTPAALGPATLAVRARGASATPGTVRSVTFRHARTVTVAPGADVVSDPVQLPVSAGRDLLVSLVVPGVVATPTEHWITNQVSYLTPNGTGDHSADEAGTAFLLPSRTAFSNGWYFLSGVDVVAPPGTGAVVAFGDSITDGFQALGYSLVENPAGLDVNARYPDFLASRLRAAGRPLAVLDEGISGNKVLSDPGPPYPFGLAATTRFAKDALELPGVTDVILLEGINDLGTDASLPASRLVAGLAQLVRRAQEAGLRVHLGTLTPAGGTAEGYGSAQTEQRRQEVNRWIRTRSGVDVVDFDAALRDPAHPSQLRPAYDSSDHLHPSTAGYRAMADAVRLAALRGATCG